MTGEMRGPDGSAAPARWLARTSPYSATETLGRLREQLIVHGGITVFESIDQSRIAGAGASVEMLQFENPELVAQIIAIDPSAAFDLPIRALAWTDDTGRTQLRATHPSSIAPGQTGESIGEIRDTIARLLGSWLDGAVGDGAVGVGAVGDGAVGLEDAEGQDRMHLQRRIRSVAESFHKNFSAGEIDANGMLAAEDVHVDSNTVIVRGRDAFVERLRRYDVPFPGLQLRDEIILVEGHAAAILYHLQGRHLGPFGGQSSTGFHVEAYSGEFFDFDEDAMLTRLQTTTRLDLIRDQIHGRGRAATHPDVVVAATQTLPESVSARVRDALPEVYSALAAGGGVEAWLTDEARVLADHVGVAELGPPAWAGEWNASARSFSELRIRITRVVQQGNRVAVGYEYSGVHTGDYVDSSGAIHAATGRALLARGIDFLRVTSEGSIDEVVSVRSSDDVVASISAE